MKIIRSIHQLRKTLAPIRRKKQRIGFVPTMGYFHQGHLSLMKKSKQENDCTVVSLFVNPTQFSPGEDFKKYPRNKKQDECLAKNENVDIMFYPSEKTMYPNRYLTYVDVTNLSETLCGRTRANHFLGVTTIVCKLLNIVEPDVLYLGQKDAQQAVIIAKMIEDLNFKMKIKVMPIIREKNGLAMSSRNSYLTTNQRQEACVLFQSLKRAKDLIKKGERRASIIKNIMKQVIQKHSDAKIDYIECSDAQTLTTLKNLKGTFFIALAVYFGTTRLIDNIRVNVL
ncbi:MAG: pantoate--beta-alanine ligase [Candidatus Omnitrophota bacterium]